MGYTQLTEIGRYQIQVLLKANFSISTIARGLHRHSATIGREIARNSGLRGYRPGQAQRFAEERRQRHSPGPYLDAHRDSSEDRVEPRTDQRLAEEGKNAISKSRMDLPAHFKR